MHKFSKDFLRDYFFGRLSEEKADKVAEWFADDSCSNELHRELSAIWNDLPEHIDRAVSLDAYERFLKATSKGREVGKRGSAGFFVKAGRWAVRIAAVAMVPLGIAAIHFNAESQKPKNWIEKQVPYGEKARVVLPDNSVVWLNAGSKIIYPEKFNRNIRQVFVTGEAYAEVDKEQRPFYLSAGGVNVKVLGTKFNVKSYPEQSKTEVSLIEGSIALDVLSFDGSVKHYSMAPGSFMSFDRFTGEVKNYRFSPADYLSWSDEHSGFYLRDMSFEEITQELERKFDVRIIIRDEGLKHEHYYASFVNNESLDEILSKLDIHQSYRFKRSDGVVDIYRTDDRNIISNNNN